MNRALMALVVIEGVAIALLVFALVTQQRPVTSLNPGPGQPDLQSPVDAGAASSGRLGHGKGGLESVPTSPFVEAQEAAWSPDDPVGILLFGTVVDEQRQPVADGMVSLRGSDGKRLSATSGAFGGYAVAGLSPGSWRLTCKAKDYREFETELDLDPSQATRREDITLERAVILKVKVMTPDGKPLQEALNEEEASHLIRLSAVATAAPPARDFPPTPDSGHFNLGLGRFTPVQGITRMSDALPKEYVGILELGVRLPVSVSLLLRHVVLQTKQVPSGAEEVEFVISTSEVFERLSGVRGRLVDAITGASIPEGHVTVNDRQTHGGGAATEKDGTFLQERLRPGLMTIRIGAPEYEMIHHYITLMAGQVLDLGTIRLHKGMTIRGQVLDSLGNGVGAAIAWRNLDRMTDPEELDLGSWRQTAVDGRFTINGMGPGRHLFMARSAGMPATVELVTITTGTEEPVLRLPATRGQLVLEARGQPTDYRLFQILNGDGLPVFARRMSGNWTREYQLPPGSYTLRIFEDARLLKTIPFTIGDEPVTLTVP